MDLGGGPVAGAGGVAGAGVVAVEGRVGVADEERVRVGGAVVIDVFLTTVKVVTDFLPLVVEAKVFLT